ncbi:hypothetical protein PG985_008457 [Apiospora marii]|uniref:uncharacterized protein n=1 Tax=Apiospora marii TaxID=335849 RepID=UPI00312D4D57
MSPTTDDEANDVHGASMPGTAELHGGEKVDQNHDDAAADRPKRTITGFKVADLQPAIVEDFKSPENLAWIGVSFMLGNATILPL